MKRQLKLPLGYILCQVPFIKISFTFLKAIIIIDNNYIIYYIIQVAKRSNLSIAFFSKPILQVIEVHLEQLGRRERTESREERDWQDLMGKRGTQASRALVDLLGSRALLACR